jgi:hypothetical protein
VSFFSLNELNPNGGPVRAAHQLSYCALLLAPKHELGSPEVSLVSAVEPVGGENPRDVTDGVRNFLGRLVILKPQSIGITVNDLRPTQVLGEAKELLRTASSLRSSTLR